MGAVGAVGPAAPSVRLAVWRDVQAQVRRLVPRLADNVQMRGAALCRVRLEGRDACAIASHESALVPKAQPRRREERKGGAVACLGGGDGSFSDKSIPEVQHSTKSRDAFLNGWRQNLNSPV